MVIVVMMNWCVLFVGYDIVPCSCSANITATHTTLTAHFPNSIAADHKNLSDYIGHSADTDTDADDAADDDGADDDADDADDDDDDDDDDVNKGRGEHTDSTLCKYWENSQQLPQLNLLVIRNSCVRDLWSLALGFWNVEPCHL